MVQFTNFVLNVFFFFFFFFFAESKFHTPKAVSAIIKPKWQKFDMTPVRESFSSFTDTMYAYIVSVLYNNNLEYAH